MPDRQRATTDPAGENIAWRCGRVIRVCSVVNRTPFDFSDVVRVDRSVLGDDQRGGTPFAVQIHGDHGTGHPRLGEIESRLAVLVPYHEAAGNGPPSGTPEGGAVRREPEVVLFRRRFLTGRERGIPLAGPGPGWRGGVAVTQPWQIREHDVELCPGAGCQRGVGACGELVQAEHS